jgi:hypothetical protein
MFWLLLCVQAPAMSLPSIALSRQIPSRARTNLRLPDPCYVCNVYAAVVRADSSGVALFNCFVKADPFKGQNGWTGPPKRDIWIPDSQV